MPEFGLQVSVQVFEAFEHLVSGDWLRRVARSTLAVEGTASPATGGQSALGIVMADDEAVRALNRKHRGLDETTDVLAFPFHRQDEYYGQGSSEPDAGEFILPPGEEAGLGEVIVSYPQALRQAEHAGHSPDRELALLVAHGVLHLLGHDHAEADEEAEMKEKEAAVLALVLQDE